MDRQFTTAVINAFTTDAAKLRFTDAGLPPVETIDKFRGQPLNPEQFEFFPLPAVFYAMRCDWVKNGKIYTGNMTVEFHIVQDQTWETSNISTNQEEGLKQVDFLTLVRQILDGISSANTGALTRQTDINVDSGVTIYDLLTYNSTYADPVSVSGGRTYVEVTPGLNLTGNLKDKFRT